MKLWTRVSPRQISKIVPYLLAMLALLAVFLFPYSTLLRYDLLLVAGVTLLYAIVIHLPLLKGHATIATSRASPIAHTLMISFAVVLLGNAIPTVATVYMISIAALGIRRGLKYALFTAFLSSIGYLSALTLAPGIRLEDTDSAVLIGLFFLIALLVGLLSEAAQRQARESENIVTRSREAIMILDAHGNFEYLNPAALAIGGYAVEELKGHSFFEVIDPADHANARAVWDSLGAQASTDQVFQVRLRRKDGETRVLAATLAVHDPDTPRYLVIARDITAQEIDRAAHDHRLRELEAERTVAAAVSQTLDLPRVLDVALEQALSALQVDAGAIYLADDAQTELTLAVGRHPSPEYATRWKRHLFGEGITGNAAALRETILVPNLDLDARVSMENRESPRLLSQVSVPLIAQDRVVGVLNVNGYEPQHFTQDDAALLRAIGASVAVAIDHARLYETLEHRVVERSAELATLNRIALAVNQSLDLTRVLETALEELTSTLQVRGGWIHLLNPESDKLELKAERGSTPDVHNYVVQARLDDGLLGLSVQNRKPTALNLEESNVRSRATMLEAGYRSMVAVPLVVGGEVVGGLILASDRRNRFGEAELRLLTAAGNTLAVTLKNASMFQLVERQVKQLGALREIDHTLSSMLELEPMLQATLSRLEEIVPYDSAAVLLLDGKTLRAVAARGREENVLKQFALDISTNAIFAEMDEQRVPIMIDDLTKSSPWAVVPGLESARAWLGAPLVARGELIGQIGIFSGTPGKFTREHAELVLSFANHAAITIANAQLRAALNAQARCDSLTQVLNHGTFIEELRAAAARGEPIAMIMFDLDNFKQYNDTYGHVVGDTVLQATAQAIRAHVKNTDSIGRWGGEEFAIALCGAKMDGALRVAERIRVTLAETPIKDRHAHGIPAPTASQGIAALPETARDVDELIEQADRALYRAKSHGRDQTALTEK